MLAIDSLNRPLAVVHDSSIRPKASVVRWDGVATWKPLGDAPVSQGLQHSLVVDGHDRAVLGGIGQVLRSNQ